MSIPESVKKTNHQVVKVTNDYNYLKYFVIANILLTAILLFSLFYAVTIINEQTSAISKLSTTIN